MRLVKNLLPALVLAVGLHGVMTMTASAGGVVCQARLILGELGFDVNATCIESVGNIAYVGLINGDVQIIDIGDPLSPTLLSSYQSVGSVSDLMIDDDRMFFTYFADNMNAGVQIIDVSDPVNPSYMNFVYNRGGTNDAWASGDRVYLATGAGLKTFDISGPLLPVQVGIFEPGDSMLAVRSIGTTVFLGSNGNESLRVLDLADPLNPMVIGSLPLGGGVRQISISDGIGYLLTGEDRLVIADLSDPAQPTQLSEIDLSDILRPNQDSVGVRVDTERLYLTVYDQLRVYDIQDPSAPVQFGQYRTTAYAAGVAVVGETAAVATGKKLQVFDVSSPTLETPRLGFIDLPGMSLQTELVGDTAYLADGSNGLKIFDVSSPSDPQLLGAFNTRGIAYGVRVRDGIAYIGEGSPGTLEIVDVSNPSDPTRLSWLSFSRSVYGLDIEGDYAYLAESFSGVDVVDISDPARPIPVAFISSVDESIQTEVHGALLYIADYFGGLQIYDVSNPLSPVWAGQHPTQHQTHDIAISGTRAFVADGNAGLAILDVSNPAAPTELGRYASDGFANRVTTDGDRAYLMTLSRPFQIIDVVDPTSPELIAEYVTDGWIRDATVSGELAFAAISDGGFEVIDLSDCGKGCIADLSGDGSLNFIDVSLFIQAFTNSDLEADFTADGVLDFFDISAFLVAYGEGCP